MGEMLRFTVINVIDLICQLLEVFANTWVFFFNYISGQELCISSGGDTWSDNKVRELILVEVLLTSLLNITVVAFKVLLLESYAPMPAPSPPFKTILELVFWNDLQSCHHITLNVINVIKMTSFQYILYLREQKKLMGARSGE
jgi:hypothetical protein